MIDVWKIIESYYQNKDLVDMQIESYNELVVNTIPSIITSQHINIPIDKTRCIVVHFTNVYIDRPYIYDNNRNKQKLYPIDARRRDMTYDTSVSADIEMLIVDRQTHQVINSQLITKVELFTLPVMLKSCICNLNDSFSLHDEDMYNNGGYFIVKGKERTLVAQERINYNQIYVYKSKKDKYRYIAEIRSLKESADYSVMLQAKLCSDYKLVFNIPYISHDIPIFIVFKAMGMSVEEVFEHLKPGSVEETLCRKSARIYGHMTRDECIAYISEFTLNRVDESRKIHYTTHIIDYEILPHIGLCSDLKHKGIYLIKMIVKLIHTYTEERPEDDRDHICNKRIEMSGELLAYLINALFKRSIKSTQQFLEKKCEDNLYRFEDINITNILGRFNINQRLYYCFTTGNWGVAKSKYMRQGVSQTLNRMSYLGTLSHLCRVTVPIGKESQNTQVRQINSTYYGFMCPVETPEGQSVGIVKNFSLMTRISNHVDTVYIVDIINTLFTDRRVYTLNGICLLVNGVWIGSIPYDSVQSFIDRFKYLRSIYIIPDSVSIAYDDIDEEIHIQSDNGRILRPVINMKKVHQLQPLIESCSIGELWNKLIDENIVLFIDGGEAEASRIAVRIEEAVLYSSEAAVDYSEIHPCLIMGICANTIPFPDHSQAPRNVYTSAMMKQAIGMYAYSYNQRFDTIAHVLNYPQKKLVTTKIAQFCHMEDMPSGINAIVAVSTYGGWNQEDSIILKRSSLERGMFNSISYKTVSIDEKKKGTHDFEVVQLPPKNLWDRNYDYSKLQDNGMIKEGTPVVRNDVLIGKVYYDNDIPVSDCSLICKASEEGIVDRILVTTNSAGYKHIKVTIRRIRIPEIGDKFCQISAQKGTCGMIFSEEDMPFTANGITPDIIINPHAIPSRMTVNMIMEMHSAKAACFTGKIQDASAFDWDGEELCEDVGRELVNMGYEFMGNEIMYNGFTGRPMKSRIFIGPCYYQRLKHLVSGKLHSRSVGNVQTLSRQPCAGRSRDGGLRCGEMERDSIIVHGAASFLRERLFCLSDYYYRDICPKCGTLVNTKNTCMNCGYDKTVSVYIPYACKLLFQLLQAMCVKIRIKPSE